MSEKVGFRVYGCLGCSSKTLGYSEDIKRKIESEIERILQESYDRVVDLLSKHKAQLDLLANALVLKKTLYGDDVRELIEESLSTASSTGLGGKKDRDESPNVVCKGYFQKMQPDILNKEHRSSIKYRMFDELHSF